MLENLVELARSLVRPVVTIGLDVAFCVAAFQNVEAAKLIGPLALLATGFWFKDRQEEKRQALRERM